MFIIQNIYYELNHQKKKRTSLNITHLDLKILKMCKL